MKAHLRFPEDKEELLGLVDQGNAQPFHAKTCAHCHGPTKYADWQSLRIRANQLSAAYSIDYYSSYEPFYIARTSATPYYDERFKAYGYDRISQVCEMHVKGWVTKTAIYSVSQENGPPTRAEISPFSSDEILLSFN